MNDRVKYELLKAAYNQGEGAQAQVAVDIAGVQLVPIEYEGRRVLTMAMIDQVHQRPDGTAGRTFRDNRKRLVEGEDYIEIDQPDVIRRLGFSRPQGGTPAKVLLVTETGYSMLVKTFSDDLAWTVQRQLVKSYFAKPSLPVDPLAGLSVENRALVAMMCEQAAIRTEQAALARTQAEQADAILRIESNQIAAVASVQSFTALGYNIYRDLELSKAELTKLGKLASANSKARSLTIDKVADHRYGLVNSYHITALDAAYEELCK